ncbi:hypothetical protein CS0771_29710 [Catellatospora sp. IY07-71]|uniref:hypothetical protein n=1 Tax=Catellatospora sp. IY07-71 TaxID=2728827 RepID=UPI001BB454C6|nr:hypothetical protein [Catellatospora sp. IY07-71]BCJ73427.1 hypothetical protein CS0771_29710 [Catellatospora sp. IY07-71]
MRLLIAVLLITPTLIPVTAAASVPPPAPDRAAQVRAAAAPATKRLAVVMIQNGSTAERQTQLADTAYARDLFLGGTNSLASWTDAVTQGQLRFTAAGDGVYLAPPNAALAAGAGDTSKCYSEEARVTAQDHLAGLGVAWDSVAVLFDIGACGWAGLGQVPGRVTWFPPRPSLAAVVHEVGHNHGYPHETRRDCPGSIVSSCKANGYSGNSPMGSGGAGRGYSSPELLHSGWLAADRHRDVAGSGTYTLTPLHAPASAGGLRAVEVKASRTLHYLVELRARGAVDSAVDKPGVRVYAVPVSGNTRDYRNAYMINPTRSGSPLLVPVGTVLTDQVNKLTITVRAASASSARVEVSPLGGRPSPSPSVSVTPSASPLPSAAPLASFSATPEAAAVSTPAVAAAPPPAEAPEVSLLSTTQQVSGVLIGGAMVALVAGAGFWLLGVRNSGRRRPRRRHAR